MSAYPSIETICNRMLDALQGESRKNVWKSARTRLTRFTSYRVTESRIGRGALMGELRGNQIRSAHLVEWQESMQREGRLSAKTIANYSQGARRALRWGAERDLCVLPPVLGARSHVALGPPDTLSEDELGDVYAIARGHQPPGWQLGPMEIWIRLQGDCGMRCGEAWWLRWDEIDFETGVVALRDHEDRKLKTRRAARVVPLTPRLLALLKGVERVNRFVIPRAAQTPWSEVGGPWCTLCKRYRRAIPRFKPSLLRHSFASRVVAHTGDATRRELQAVLGHASIVTTDRYYAAPVATRVLVPEVA